MNKNEHRRQVVQTKKPVRAIGQAFVIGCECHTAFAGSRVRDAHRLSPGGTQVCEGASAREVYVFQHRYAEFKIAATDVNNLVLTIDSERWKGERFYADLVIEYNGDEPMYFNNVPIGWWGEAKSQ
jgi:hypothetical protein